MLHIYYYILITSYLTCMIQEGDRIDNMHERRRRHGLGRTEPATAPSRAVLASAREGSRQSVVGTITTSSCRASLSWDYEESRAANQTWRFGRCLRCQHTVSSGVVTGTVARRRLLDGCIRLCHRELTDFGR